MFLPQALLTPVDQLLSGKLGAEDAYILWTFLPKIVFIKSLFPKKQQDGCTPDWKAQQLSLIEGIASD